MEAGDDMLRERTAAIALAAPDGAARIGASLRAAFGATVLDPVPPELARALDRLCDPPAFKESRSAHGPVP